MRLLIISIVFMSQFKLYECRVWLPATMAAGDRVFELMDTPSEESGEESSRLMKDSIEFKM